MAKGFNHGAVDVGTAPAILVSAPPGIDKVLIQNVSDVTVFVGASDVAADGERRGFGVKPGESVEISSYEHDVSELYGVIAQHKTVDAARVVYLVGVGS